METDSSRSVAVVVCAYTESRWDDLLRAVRSLRCQTYQPAEIVVVIDHNPALFARVCSTLSDVLVVENEGQRGLSGARNTGVNRSTSAIVAFMDEDAHADTRWLEQLTSAFTDPQVMIAGGAIIPDWDGGRPRWFPEEFDWVVGCTYLGMPEVRAAVRNVIGCNMAIRRTVFDAVGGFRIGRVGVLSIGQENDETELCMRTAAQIPMARVEYLPDARVMHRVPLARANVRYGMRRCFSEGVSKARLARSVGTQTSLSSERNYTLRTLPGGVLHGLQTLSRGDFSGGARALAILVGFGVTVSGYVFGRVRSAPTPVRERRVLSRSS